MNDDSQPQTPAPASHAELVETDALYRSIDALGREAEGLRDADVIDLLASALAARATTLGGIPGDFPHKFETQDDDRDYVVYFGGEEVRIVAGGEPEFVASGRVILKDGNAEVWLAPKRGGWSFPEGISVEFPDGSVHVGKVEASPEDGGAPFVRLVDFPDGLLAIPSGGEVAVRLGQSGTDLTGRIVALDAPKEGYAVLVDRHPPILAEDAPFAVDLEASIPFLGRLLSGEYQGTPRVGVDMSAHAVVPLAESVPVEIPPHGKKKAETLSGRVVRDEGGVRVVVDAPAKAED